MKKITYENVTPLYQNKYLDALMFLSDDDNKLLEDVCQSSPYQLNHVYSQKEVFLATNDDAKQMGETDILGRFRKEIEDEYQKRRKSYDEAVKRAMEEKDPQKKRELWNVANKKELALYPYVDLHSFPKNVPVIAITGNKGYICLDNILAEVSKRESDIDQTNLTIIAFLNILAHFYLRGTSGKQASSFAEYWIQESLVDKIILQTVEAYCSNPNHNPRVNFDMIRDYLKGGYFYIGCGSYIYENNICDCDRFINRNSTNPKSANNWITLTNSCNLSSTTPGDVQELYNKCFEEPTTVSITKILPEYFKNKILIEYRIANERWRNDAYDWTSLYLNLWCEILSDDYNKQTARAFQDQYFGNWDWVSGRFVNIYGVDIYTKMNTAKRISIIKEMIREFNLGEVEVVVVPK